ncbi:MAG: hypothetical protein CVV45_09380 [Spirochaetae bacterium HGW-Spirochaetae-10]|nr:MAG: hypothetical protein CVV45_09380 [Spirochaetae bacterium HGW-Spirochaetae-10]
MRFEDAHGERRERALNQNRIRPRTRKIPQRPQSEHASGFLSFCGKGVHRRQKVAAVKIENDMQFFFSRAVLS